MKIATFFKFCYALSINQGNKILTDILCYNNDSVNILFHI
jgi:hypothetical protein